ncbi:MAG TPA: GGDEF domain-containing phosphodiesterase [Novosphingobium sp.]|nr:GGDEF domain-containing phosphodiesterase [Novosphingobium sp.]
MQNANQEFSDEVSRGLRPGLTGRLIGLPGMETARARIAEWIAEAASPAHTGDLHMMLLGLRRFDTVNLAYGAVSGDGALAEVAARLQHCAASELEDPSIVAHAGGGKFMLAASEPCSRERWQLIAEQLADVVSRPIVVPAGVVRLSPRIALLRRQPREAVDAMLDRLSRALDRAQELRGQRLAWAEEGGKGGVAPPGRSAAQLEADLLGAIDRDEIGILFQPQFALSGGGVEDDRLMGAEALARWDHPEVGRIGARALFSIAERTDHLAPLSRHIAGRALTLAQGWPDHVRLSLNVTPTDLAFGSYVQQLLDLVRESGFPPRRLTLEVTEQALLHDVEQAAEMMAEFSAAGIRIALDDFGAGFCNFRYLKILPLHYLKLDRSMVDGIATDRRDLAVLRAIVAMAGALDLQVIVEGVESEAQRALIAAEGCTFYQGFLRAQPMSAERFLAVAQTSASGA